MFVPHCRHLLEQVTFYTLGGPNSFALFLRDPEPLGHYAGALLNPKPSAQVTWCASGAGAVFRVQQVLRVCRVTTCFGSRCQYCPCYENACISIAQYSGSRSTSLPNKKKHSSKHGKTLGRCTMLVRALSIAFHRCPTSPKISPTQRKRYHFLCHAVTSRCPSPPDWSVRTGLAAVRCLPFPPPGPFPPRRRAAAHGATREARQISLGSRTERAPRLRASCSRPPPPRRTSPRHSYFFVCCPHPELAPSKHPLSPQAGRPPARRGAHAPRGRLYT